MANPNKRIQKITEETVARWADTINSTAEPDVAGAEKLFKTVFPGKRMFTARTPLEFYVAQAVLRGRLTKKDGVEMAKTLHLNPAFIKPLTKVGGPVQLLHGRYRRFGYSGPTDMLSYVAKTYLRMAPATTSNRETRAFDLLARQAKLQAMGNWHSDTIKFQLQHLHDLYWQFVTNERRYTSREDSVSPELKALRDYRLSFSNTQNHITNSVLSLAQVISGHPGDIAAGEHDAKRHEFDAIQAEIMAKTLGCHKDPDCTWLYEIFHLVPAVMQFNNGFLVLSGKPELHKNSDNELHNESGPAVTWADGHKAWFIGGHKLSNETGEKIVMAPDTLTKADIDKIQNEEERRIAIDRMGWNRYLAAIGAKVAHSRENWVDNTYEVLISPPKQTHPRGWGVEEPLRMVLSCRSTGRKYFLAVPRDVPIKNLTEKLIAARKTMTAPGRSMDLRDIQNRSVVPLTTCEEAQKWFAEGANTKYLDYAKHSINVVGAS